VLPSTLLPYIVNATLVFPERRERYRRRPTRLAEAANAVTSKNFSHSVL
jgi:hypothetical protein